MQVFMIFAAFAVVGVILRILMMIIAAFAGHIILFDSVVLAFIAGLVARFSLKIHSAYALLVGIAVFFLLFWLQNTKVGFYVIGLVMSVAWGFIFGMIVYLFTSDMIWFYVIWGLSTVFVIGLHFNARGSSTDATYIEE
ncbi:MAG: hypothetical protein R3Y07_04965 [Eubacteriales bacterium]